MSEIDQQGTRQQSIKFVSTIASAGKRKVISVPKADMPRLAELLGQPVIIEVKKIL